MLFKLDFFSHHNLYCYVKYSNVEYEVRIFKTCHLSDAQKHMIESSFEHDFRICMNFSSQNSALVYSLEALSLEPK